MFHVLRKKILLLWIEFFIFILVIWLQISSLNSISSIRQHMENSVYDLMVKTSVNKSKLRSSPVAIIDVDEKSLRAEGRWPWPRNKLAELVKHLSKAKVVVVAFDMTFSKPDNNIAEQLVNVLQVNPPSNMNSDVLKFLNTLLPQFDYDKQFADSLKASDVVLGIVFHDDLSNPPLGKLPAPVFAMSDVNVNHLVVPKMISYWGNIDILQDAAKRGGFLTTIPDSDGVLRRSPLLIRYGDTVYPSLALEAVRVYLLLDKIGIKTARTGDIDAVEGVMLGATEIPTDALGQVIIPYVGRARTLPYVSATDVLHDKGDLKPLENAVVFVGTSALGMSDLHASPVQASFPGIEVQASIAAGLLSGYFPYKPDWAKGAEVATTFTVGLAACLVFPCLGVIGLVVFSLVLIATVTGINFSLMQSYGLVLSSITSVLLVIFLMMVNLAYGFLFEYRQRAFLKAMFGQYIPPARVELLSEGSGQSTLQGETKELTVLFADVQGFTTLSEKLSASGVKEVLNRFFTPMTEIIFARNGTIDKYVGDMLMAFWGAPVVLPNHAKDALEAALDMRAMTKKLKDEFVQSNLPPIDIGIGLNTGMMHVGDMGSKFRLAYTVLGDAVNLGSRIEALTRHYGVHIAVGEATRKTQDDFIFRKLDRVKVKGKVEAIEIFELICRKSEITEDIKKELEHYDQALQYYFTQQWEKANVLFALLHEQYPTTKLYELYVERIAHLHEEPPTKDWDGVYTWKVK